MKLLETRSLSIGYPIHGGTNKALQNNINVQIRSGEIISLMGQNGVGKTTFIKTISDLLPSLSGDIFYGNINLKDLSSSDLAKRLSLVLTERSFSYNISVLELIAIGRHPYSNWMGALGKRDKDMIEWAIAETNTHYLANKKLSELSDGQLQKVMIARALAQETDLIILDEPTAHLDLHNKIEVMILLRQIAKQGKGILISTHDMQISTQLSDRLWLFNFNELVHEGIPEDLILNGMLEKTLYLKDYGYDMIHGSVRMAENGPTVVVEGPQDIKYWTQQALKRQGFHISELSARKVIYLENQWTLHYGDTQRSFDSIEDLLKGLENEKVSMETPWSI